MDVVVRVIMWLGDYVALLCFIGVLFLFVAYEAWLGFWVVGIGFGAFYYSTFVKQNGRYE